MPLWESSSSNKQEIQPLVGKKFKRRYGGFFCQNGLILISELSVPITKTLTTVGTDMRFGDAAAKGSGSRGLWRVDFITFPGINQV